MTSVVLLNILPISCIIFFLINTIASTIWQNFVRIFNKSEGVFDAYVPLSKSIFNYLLIAAMLFVVFLFNSGAFIVNFQKMQIAAILFSLLAFTQTSRTSALTLDHMIFCTFVVFASLFLILSKDLISVFFTLELLNMLIIYSFFFNATGVRLNAVNSSIKICASCIYQFILNFFSSIILYSAINWYIGLTGGASFSNAYLLSEESALKAPLSVLLGAFLLKFGSGPWIFFKINIYRNMNLSTAFLYTVIYLTVVLIFFFNLIFLWNIHLPTIVRTVITLLASMAALAFSGLAFQTNNFYIFLSFSSLINITVFLLQGMSALCV